MYSSLSALILFCNSLAASCKRGVWYSKRCCVESTLLTAMVSTYEPEVVLSTLSKSRVGGSSTDIFPPQGSSCTGGSSLGEPLELFASASALSKLRVMLASVGKGTLLPQQSQQ